MNNINEKFKTVVNQLMEDGHKITKIAKAMGYTTTTQLYNSMEENSNITSSALKKFIINFNVNPNYIFFGKGKMFNIINENNIGYIIYNPENNVYLGANDCFFVKINTCNIFNDDMFAKSIKFKFQSQYPDNPFGKNLEIKKVLVEEFEE